MLGFHWRSLLLAIAMAIAAASATFFEPFNVTYDHRSIIIGGKRRMLISAGIHYPRATPNMWPGIIAKSKEGGADVIETYVFWNGHEPIRGQYHFGGRYDIVKFAKLVGSNGLYLLLRIGPYACAEWNFGGFPVWLRDIPGIEFRTDNIPFKDEMQRFVVKIVDLMKQEMLFSWQGGPIILLQIENEYGNIEGSYGQRGKEYVKWAAQMALGLGAGVPWVMCRQTDAPDTIINTCNAFYCDGFKPNLYNKPTLWTEDWNGWFANWGERLPHRPVEDNAFAVARFFQRWGSFHNYYMVAAQVSLKIVESGSSSYSNTTEPVQLLVHNDAFSISKNWKFFKEPIGSWDRQNFTAQGILEHLNVTKDTSDYLWYITRINVSDEDVAFWEENSILPSLRIDKIRDVVRIFVNGHLAGSQVGSWVRVQQPIHLIQGFNELALLSETVGLQNYGAFLEKDGAGFKGRIKLTGMKNQELDLTNSLWTYQVGLMGEFRKLYAPEEEKNADWSDLQPDSVPSAFTWFKTCFDAPKGNDPVALYLGSMGKGQAWINGHGIGRYWSRVAPKDGCPKSCDYRGAYNDNKCRTNCGELTQSWYHVPRTWLKPSDNLLVIFEETSGNPLEIWVRTHSTKTICAQVLETHYPPLSAWSHPNSISGRARIESVPPELHLRCDDGHTISSVTFASFGTPRGTCRSFSEGSCHAASSLTVVSKECEGRNQCSVIVSIATFGDDPCRGSLKSLAVEADCTSPSDITIPLVDH